MHVIDLEGNEYPLQATTTNEYELNGNQSLSFRIIPSKVNQLFINDITEMWQVIDHDDITHKIIYLKKQGEGSSLSVEVKAIPKVFDDLDSQRIYERYDRHMTANYCFNLIFEGSGYNFILNGTYESQEWEGFGEGDTRLALFQSALNRYKAEFRVVGNTIYIENLIGRDTGFMYRYRLNASNIMQETDAGAYYTYARGYGDYGDGGGGEDWQEANLIREYTSPLADIPGIGIREGPPIKNGNITTKETMDSQLKILVDESLKISVSATIHDLRKQGYAMAQPEKGDRVFLIDERIGLNAEVRVVNMQLIRNWKKEVIGLSLTLGSPGLVKRHQANLQTAIKNITNLLEGKIKLPFSVLDNAVAEATKALQNITSELSVPPNGGLMAVDKDNPNNLVLFNAAGIGVSNDGGITFPEAITGNGINASVITAGILHGITIIQQAGNRALEMSNGELFSYYNNLLTMKFGQYSLDFFNRSGNRIGYFGTTSLAGDSDSSGLSMIVDQDYFSISTPSASGSYSPAFRASRITGATMVAGVHGTSSDLLLFGNSRIAHTPYRTDQPSILLEQGSTRDNTIIYYGGDSRRVGSIFELRHNATQNTYITMIRATHDRVRITPALYFGSGDSRIETGSNYVAYHYDINNRIRQWDTGGVDILAGNNVRQRFYSNGDADFTGGLTLGGHLRAPNVYTETTSNAANLHVFTETGGFARSTSARKYKEDIQLASDVDYKKLLELDVKSWYDKGEVKRNNDSTEGLSRYYGLIANEFEEIGLSQFAIYDNGEVENYNDRAWTLLIPNINDLVEEVSELRNRLEELENGPTETTE